jgi:hypothetical protein
MDHATTSFSTEILAGAITSLPQHLAPLRYINQKASCMSLDMVLQRAPRNLGRQALNPDTPITPGMCRQRKHAMYRSGAEHYTILKYLLLVFTIFEVLEGPIHGGNDLETSNCN